MTSSLEKSWFLPSGHRPLDLWNQTGYRKREGRRKENVFYFRSFGKSQKFLKIFAKSHSQTASFLGSLFFKYLWFSPEWWWEVLALQAELTPFGSLHGLIFCVPPPASSVASQSQQQNEKYNPSLKMFRIENLHLIKTYPALHCYQTWREAERVWCQGRQGN